MSKKIVLTGGGTVGHVTLNLILIPKFISDGWEVHYIGDKNGIEYQEIKKSGLDVTFHAIATGKLRRYFSWQNVVDIFKVALGLLQSLVVIAKIRPQALFLKVVLFPFHLSWLLNCWGNQCLFTNLIDQWGLLIKLPINSRPPCIPLLSRTTSCLEPSILVR